MLSSFVEKASKSSHDFIEMFKAHLEAGGQLLVDHKHITGQPVQNPDVHGDEDDC